eukprot:CAMPEP_0184717628 /NCGR_PEP_ID=MMETSP0314-20130426/7030_1 /TAXON_ID=38298 /ORGANISM="Rhodella maculata, Strain CCMP 736" /LENGTH=519 /DNA_ID=CAMNT_0027181219 /DNA_START=23 /DNA_END=1582 /DNA_ORIENTATION=+
MTNPSTPSPAASAQPQPDIILQGFNWESSKYKGSKGCWYGLVNSQIDSIAALGVTIIWLPPPSDSISPQGYLPRDLDNLNSAYGSVGDLKALVAKIKEKGIVPLADTVLNHRCARNKSGNGAWTSFAGKYNWDDKAIISNDPNFPGRGHRGTGVPIDIAPNIDHSQKFVQDSYIDWMKNILQKEIGFNAWRIDYARGFSGEFVGKYIEATEPYLAVGEFWDGLDYDGSYLRPNQDAHRNRIARWVDSTGKRAMAFDFTLKGILMVALKNHEYWRLKDGKGRPAGLNGSWPDRCVTFIDNHDTGSTQAHWPFPNDKVLQGYTYTLTHPGVPTVFWDHVFDWKLYDQIKKLIDIRKNFLINKLCAVAIEKADGEGYTARITSSIDPTKQLYVKLGDHNWSPSKERGWEPAFSSRGCAVWSRGGIPEPPKKEPAAATVGQALKAEDQSTPLARVQSFRKFNQTPLAAENITLSTREGLRPGTVVLTAQIVVDEAVVKESNSLQVEFFAKKGSVEQRAAKKFE